MLWIKTLVDSLKKCRLKRNKMDTGSCDLWVSQFLKKDALLIKLYVVIKGKTDKSVVIIVMNVTFLFFTFYLGITK